MIANAVQRNSLRFAGLGSELLPRVRVPDQTPPQSSAAGRGGSATGAAIFFANSLVEAHSHSQAEHEQHGLVAHLAQLGVNWWRRLAIGLSPARIATYCLPPVSNVIGGASKPVPTLIFHNSSNVASS